MNTDPIDTEGFRGKHQVSDDEWADDIEYLEWALAEAIGRAEAAEHRAIRAETRIKAVRALHQPKTLTSLIDDDCAAEMCDHEDSCPTDNTAVVCAECDRVAEAGSPYYGENGVGVALYPCPTIRALDPNDYQDCYDHDYS